MAGVHCPHCNALTAVPSGVGIPPVQGFHCQRCGTRATVELFPAFGRGLEPGRVGEATAADDAACFFHVDKRAEAACDQCGRYVCALCDISVGERHYCPNCFGGEARQVGASPLMMRSQARPGRLGFWIAASMFFLGPLAILGGPFAVYQGLRGLRSPRSLTGGRSTGLAVGAIILGTLETLIWLAFVAFIAFGLWKEGLP